MHPPIEGLLPSTVIEITSFSDFAFKVAGSQVHATTPGIVNIDGWFSCRIPLDNITFNVFLVRSVTELIFHWWAHLRVLFSRSSQLKKYIMKCIIANNFPANIYLFKVNNRNTRKRCDICSTLTIKAPEQRHWLCSSVFIVSFEHISHLFLVFLLLTLNM